MRIAPVKAVPLLAVLSFVSALARAQSAPTASEQIVLVDNVRIAFYEAAPPALAASMRRARDAACTTLRTPSSGNQAVANWLCGAAHLRYLRAVNVLGTRYRTGFVCRTDSVTPNLRYYTADMFENTAGCMAISYSDKTKRLVIVVR